MHDERGWKFYVFFATTGMASIAVILDVLMGRNGWPFDLLMLLIGK